MNMYEMIKRRFLNGEMSSEEVVQCARSGILSFAEAGKIITLDRKKEKGGGSDDEE